MVKSNTAIALSLFALLIPLAAFSGLGLVLKSFESGNYQDWNTSRLVASHSGSVTEEQARAGRFASRIELRNGDFSHNGFRAEIKDPFYAEPEQDLWYGFSVFIPANFPIEDTNSCVIAQWHDVDQDLAVSPNPHSPPLAIRYRKDRVDITVNYQAKPDQPIDRITIYREDSFPRDSWQDFAMRIFWSNTADGVVEVWRGSVKVATYNGPVGYPSDEYTSGLYVKLGLYCRETPTDPLVIFHDEFRRGETLVDVSIP